MSQGLIIDLFAGGGGASVGLEAATGRTVSVAVNHSATALAVHEANHPATRHLVSDIWEVDPLEATGGAKVDALWASPDCTHFSVAKGGKPRKQNIRSLAWVVVEWARKVRPGVIFLENVAEFLGWGPLDHGGKPVKARMGETFREWKGQLEALGYAVDHRILDASHFGAPTRRRRLFLVARCDGQPIRWPDASHGPGLAPLRSAAECIDWSIPCPSIFTRKKPLADKTLKRIAMGIRKFVFESASPFLIAGNAPTLIQTGYGERKGQRPRYLDLHEPLGTLMAGGVKHALVSAFLAKHNGDPNRKSGGGVVVGSPLDQPLGTVTTRDHHSLVTVSTAGERVDQVRAFLTAYYGEDAGQSLHDPMRTLTTRHRLGLVTVAGAEYQIADIGMRMLEPHELLRAQFGRFAATYDLSAAKTKAAQVRLIGNSVCPEAAEALVAANLTRAVSRVA
jgi:DNA (cytosine-5)-methyltransferase 1